MRLLSPSSFSFGREYQENVRLTASLGLTRVMTRTDAETFFFIGLQRGHGYDSRLMKPEMRHETNRGSPRKCVSAQQPLRKNKELRVYTPHVAYLPDRLETLQCSSLPASLAAVHVLSVCNNPKRAVTQHIKLQSPTAWSRIVEGCRGLKIFKTAGI